MKLFRLFSSNKSSALILSTLFLVFLSFSFALANKRYVNFEYGKFDLGNMSQMVWNTSQGNFMEVTDQFGSNMPRWGMSHIDPILALFAPFYWIFPHPMLLVFFQHTLIISAIFPLFALVKRKSQSITVAYLIVFSYLLYPANGFTLVWTGFHGISFVAPLLVWLVWYLEKKNFLINAKFGEKVMCWGMIILMLAGKEEIGAILALASIFLYFKNKKLAIYTFVISLTWTLVCFLFFIPSYTHLRSESVNTFLEKIEVQKSQAEFVSGENFFISRYSYLGNSYGEIILGIILKPGIVLEEILVDTKIETLNDLFGPLGYIVVFSPIWLISLPDLAIGLLSQDEIFEISNHRIAFVIVSLFLSVTYMIQFIRYFAARYIKKARYIDFSILMFALLVLVSNLYFSIRTNNPIYVSGMSFIKEKIISKILAREYELAEGRNVRIPQNDLTCLDSMVALINEYDPEIYSGPDYLGAHSSLRKVNALFPSRYWDADLLIADVFETKTLNAFGQSREWVFNKGSLRKMTALNKYSHIYSCGRMNVFAMHVAPIGSTLASDSAEFIDSVDIAEYDEHVIETKRVALNLKILELPQIVHKKNTDPIVIAAARISGSFDDKVTFWTFESADNSEKRLSIIDFVSIAYSDTLDLSEQGQYLKETYYPRLKSLPEGTYRVFFGVGDSVNAAEVYIGDIQLVN